MRSRVRRGVVTGVAAAVVVGLGFGGPVSASADTLPDPNWWYSSYHVADAHAAGWTGTGVKVAVIDEFIDPSLPTFSSANLHVDTKPLCRNAGASVTSTDPANGHGSGVTAVIVGNGQGVGSIRGIAPDADVTFYGYGVGRSDCKQYFTGNHLTPFALALHRAIASGAKIITTSIASGAVDQPDLQEVREALAKGTILLGAQGNSPSEGISYPDSLNGVVAVNAIDETATLQTDQKGSGPDVQPDTTVVAAGVDLADPYDVDAVDTGSSLAAPLVAGMLADVWQKYPRATGNQLIQSLIRNTSANSDPSAYGYGAASLTKMLAVDPTSYPDQNPLMNKKSGKGEPTKAQVAATKRALDSKTTATATGSGSANAAAGHTGSGSGPGSGVPVVGLVAGIVGILVLAGVVVLIVVLNRRSRRPPGGTPYGA